MDGQLKTQNSPRGRRAQSGQEVDPELLENLDLLMNLEIFESSADWEAINALEEISENGPEQNPSVEDDELTDDFEIDWDANEDKDQ